MHAGTRVRPVAAPEGLNWQCVVCCSAQVERRRDEQDKNSGGDSRGAKRSVISSATLVPWSVELGELLMPSRGVVSQARVERRAWQVGQAKELGRLCGRDKTDSKDFARLQQRARRAPANLIVALEQ